MKNWSRIFHQKIFLIYMHLPVVFIGTGIFLRLIQRLAETCAPWESISNNAHVRRDFTVIGFYRVLNFRFIARKDSCVAHHNSRALTDARRDCSPNETRDARYLAIDGVHRSACDWPTVRHSQVGTYMCICMCVQWSALMLCTCADALAIKVDVSFRAGSKIINHYKTTD